MGLNPNRVSYLAQAAEFLGNGDTKRIQQLGENVPESVPPFALLPEFAHLRADSGRSYRGGTFCVVLPY